MYCIVLYCIVFSLYCIVLYCIVLYCIQLVLYCIVLYQSRHYTFGFTNKVALGYLQLATFRTVQPLANVSLLLLLSSLSNALLV